MSEEAREPIADIKPVLLVLSSTYPRWQADYEPGFVHELSRRLVADFEVHVLCPHAPSALTEETLDGVHVHRFRYAPIRLETLVQGGGIITNLRHHPWKWVLVPAFFTALTWRTWRLTRQIRPDCIHAHWLFPQGLVAAILRLASSTIPPFMLTSHGADLFALRAPPSLALKRFVIRQAAAVSVVSSPMREEIARLGVDPARVAVIPMGVDFSRLFTPGRVASRQAGQMLFVGRLVEKKGLRYLIEALPQVFKAMPHARLTIVGFGPEEALLRTLAAQRGVADRVDFLGAVPQNQLPALYRNAAVFIAPFIRAASGDQEGLPVALMEAIACGCPPLVGELDVLADIFLPGEEEFQVRPQDTAEVAKKILALLSDTPAAADRTATIRDRLADRLDWDKIAAAYAQCLYAAFNA